MFDEDLQQICIKLKPVIGKRADALWLAYLTSESPRSKMEAESLIHMFAAKFLNPQVDAQSITLPLPEQEATVGQLPLGTILYQSRPQFPVNLRVNELTRHVGLLGATGSGKTNACQALLLGLLNLGTPFLVIDWKRAYRGLLGLPEGNNSGIRVFTVGRNTPAAFNWNPLRPPPGVHPKTWIMVISEALERSHISGPGVADVLMEILDTVCERQGYYTDQDTLTPNFFDCEEELGKRKFTGRRSLWRDSCSRILKTFTFSPARGSFNARHPVKLEELLDAPVILELDQELPKTLRVFFSEIILRWIHLYRLSQGETDDLRHVLVMEEAHNLFNQSYHEKNTSNSLENLFREIRGFGEGLVFISQHPSLMPIYTVGNASILLMMGLQHFADIRSARQALALPQQDEAIFDQLKVGEGILKVRDRIRPCHVRIPYIPIKKGAITDDDLRPGGSNH